MEFVPVVQVIQINGIAEGRWVIWKSVCAQDALAGGVVMDVATDSAVEFVDRTFVELNAGLLFDPGFKLWIGGLALFDEVDDGVALEADAIDDHLIIALASARITWGELAGAFQRDFKPKAWEMQDPQGTSHTRTN